jgi:hypothetical protein
MGVLSLLVALGFAVVFGTSASHCPSATLYALADPADAAAALATIRALGAIRNNLGTTSDGSGSGIDVVTPAPTNGLLLPSLDPSPWTVELTRGDPWKLENAWQHGFLGSQVQTCEWPGRVALPTFVFGSRNLTTTASWARAVLVVLSTGEAMTLACEGKSCGSVAFYVH